LFGFTVSALYEVRKQSGQRVVILVDKYVKLILDNFRSEVYALAYCRISSYLQTMANKGYNPLIAILQTVMDCAF